MLKFAQGDKVRLVNNPSKIGTIRDSIQRGADKMLEFVGNKGGE